MDILNWLYLAKNKFVRTTLGSTKDLMIFGSKVGFNKRGDLYQNYAMSAEDFTTSVADVVKPYKVYTALLTQSGGDDQQSQYSGELVIGRTYYIDDNQGNGDFTNVGAPNNNGGTSFVATGTTPNTWGIDPSTNVLTYNTGAPVVTVLENTIGNVWFTYIEPGNYRVNSLNLFINEKTIFIATPSGYNDFNILNTTLDSESYSLISTYDSTITLQNNLLNRTPIEIRVYN